MSSERSPGSSSMKLVSRSRSFFSASSPAASPGPAGRNRGGAGGAGGAGAAEAAGGRSGTVPVQGGEERDDVAGDEFGLFGWGEVPAVGHDGPAADVIEPL